MCLKVAVNAGCTVCLELSSVNVHGDDKMPFSFRLRLTELEMFPQVCHTAEKRYLGV